MSEYKERIWALVLSTGAVAALNIEDKDPLRPWAFDDFDTFSGLNISFGKTKIALQAIIVEGVDWIKTEDPAQQVGYEFAGTENESMTVNYLEGTIYTRYGHEFRFLAKSPAADGSFSDLLRAILTNPPTMEEAMATLGQRLVKAETEGRRYEEPTWPEDVKAQRFEGEASNYLRYGR